MTKDEFSLGPQRLKFQVKLTNGEIVERSKFFYTERNFESFLAGIILDLNWVFVTKLTFITLSTFIITLLISFRIFVKSRARSSNPKFRSQNYSTIVRNYILPICKKFCLISDIDAIFYPLLMSMLYLDFMPWTLGFLLVDQIGVVFSWGIRIGGTMTPANMTYFYGTFAIIMLYIPMLMSIMDSINGRHGTFSRQSVLLLLTIILQVRHFWIQTLTYGLLAGFSPFGIGWISLNIYLRYKISVLTETELENCSKIFGVNK